jgi:ribosomal protein S17E
VGYVTEVATPKTDKKTSKKGMLFIAGYLTRLTNKKTEYGRSHIGGGARNVHGIS